MTEQAACGHPQDWAGLYRRDYDLASPGSYKHPAKASWDVAFRILEHLEELGLIDPEQGGILDPMAGTGRFLIAACAKGCKKAIGVELEDRFCQMLRDNVAYASKRLGRDLDIKVIKGDARKLSQLLQEQGLVSITSPPYLSPERGGGIAQEGYTKFYQKDKIGGGNLDPVGQRTYMPENIGSSPGQIGALPDRPLKAVMSPPYANRLDGGSPEMAGNIKPYSGGPTAWHTQRPQDNIGNLPDRPLKCVTSPPYEDSKIRSMSPGAVGKRWEEEGFAAHDNPAGYGQAEEQIGRKGEQESQESYLLAMRQVYAEVARVADVLVVVTKNPTRNGQLRRLDLDTIALLEATSWKIVCHHHALLFSEQIQGHLFDTSVKQAKGRLSFFRRLAWAKGSPTAQWEDVMFAVRDGVRAGGRNQRIGGEHA